jgi:urate oxidase
VDATDEMKLVASYGKQNVPVFKVYRDKDNEEMHHVIDMLVNVTLSGEVQHSWLKGENHQIVPTETQKNTCYANALKSSFDCCESYAIELANDLLSRHSHLSTAIIEINERQWTRVVGRNGENHEHAFYTSPHPDRWWCKVKLERTGFSSQTSYTTTVISGLKDLTLLKSTKSGFEGFIKDKYTDLKPVTEHQNRILSTVMDARWKYTSAPTQGFKAAREAVKETLIQEFAGPAPSGRFSRSMQETAWKMGTEALNENAAIKEIFIETPNVHYYCYPLSKFGLENQNIVFQSTNPDTTASGRIETHVTRQQSKL